MIGELGNHLWQSTVFVAVAALVAFALRNNGAGRASRNRAMRLQRTRFAAGVAASRSRYPRECAGPSAPASGGPGDLDQGAAAAVSSNCRRFAGPSP
jgi:hypothetical protein